MLGLVSLTAPLRRWYSDRPSQGPGSTGPRLPQSGALLGVAEGLCREETVGVNVENR